MTQAQEGYADKIIADAKALLDSVQRDLEKSGETLRAMGIDQAKILPTLAPHMGPKEQETLKQMLAADHEAIDREVAENMAHAGVATKSTGGKKRRAMI
ncbi:MAG: hypothetical protein ABIR26_13720 [Ramlibacter sp.]